MITHRNIDNCSSKHHCDQPALSAPLYKRMLLNCNSVDSQQCKHNGVSSYRDPSSAVFVSRLRFLLVFLRVHFVRILKTPGYGMIFMFCLEGMQYPYQSTDEMNMG